MNDWKEIQQRRMNVTRQESELSSLRDEARRLDKEIDHALTKLLAKGVKDEKPSKECFYCSEMISERAKVCPICRNIFVEHALEVFKMEKMTREALRNEEV